MQLTGVTPVFPVADVDATARWYQDVLGFDGVEIFLQRVEGYSKPDLSARRAGGVWDAYLSVTGLSHMWERVSDLPGARGPEQRWYGQREIEVRDPNGYLLVFAEQTEGGET